MGGCDCILSQFESFIWFYQEFYDALMKLDERERNDFLTKANDLLDDHYVGEVLGCGDE